MQSRKGGWYRGVAYGVVTMGSALLLVASRPSGNTLVSYLAAPLPAARTCAEFWATEFENDTQLDGDGEGAVNLRLVRNRGWNQLRMDQHGRGGWVGGVHNRNQNTDSKKFPLKRTEMGCIWFFTKMTPSGVLGHGADFYHSDATKRPEPLTALYCPYHGTEMKKPFWDVVPPKCETVHFSTGSITVVVTNPAGGPLTAEIFRAELEKALVQSGLPKSAVPALLKRVVDDDAGPWYPCSSDGCCRAT